jgi:hypothetical protein
MICSATTALVLALNKNVSVLIAIVVRSARGAAIKLNAVRFDVVIHFIIFEILYVEFHFNCLVAAWVAAVWA